MLQAVANKNLSNYNTFRIEARCKYFFEINTIQDLLDIIHTNIYRENPRLIIGGGSNILFTKDFDGLVIKNNLKGISIVSEDKEKAEVKVMAGENWHEFVMWCLERGYGGLENLSLIPGCVGASPMQNIGAYGVEIKEVFKQLEAFDMHSGEKKIFDKEACKFGYRESVFKHEYKDRYMIASVTYVLSKHPKVNTSYGAISSELKSAGITDPGIREVSDAVIRIRKSKLPDPAQIGNAGSFFKNPEVSAEKHVELKMSFPDLVSYPLENGNYKLAAGWLIEQSGLKGYQHKGAAVHDKQALVLVNKDHCTGNDVYELSTYVMQKVFDKFGVALEREVNII